MLGDKRTHVSASDKSVAAGGDIVDSVITINQRDSSDKALIDYLITHNQSLIAENSKLKEQVEPAVVGLSDLDESQEAIEQARAALATGDTKKAKELYRNAAQRAVDEGEQLFRQAAEYYISLGALAYLNDTTESLEAYKQASKLDPENTEAWNRLGLLYLRNSDLVSAEIAFKNVLSLAQSLDDKYIAGNAIGNLGTVDEMLGKTQQAEEKYLRALDLHKEVGDLGGMANEYGSLSALNRRCGRFPEALKLLSEAKQIFSKMDNQAGVANVDVSEAAILVSLQKFEKAEQLYRQALQYFKSSGHRHDEAYQHANLGNLYVLWQKPIDLSMGECKSALELFESLKSIPGIALASFGVARAYLVKGQLDKAARYAQRSLDLYRKTEDSVGTAGALGIIASVTLNQGDSNNAERFSDEAMAIYKFVADKERTAATLVFKGEICRSRGEYREQRIFYKEALDLYREISSPLSQKTELWIKELDDYLDD